MKLLLFTKQNLPESLVREFRFYQVHFHVYQEGQALDLLLEKVDAVCFLFLETWQALLKYHHVRDGYKSLPIFSFTSLTLQRPDAYFLQFPAELSLAQGLSFIKEALAMNISIGARVIGPFSLDREARMVRLKNKATRLTFKEFEILELLLLNHDRVTSREQIIHYAWDRRSFVAPNTIDVYISRIKRKLNILKPFLKTVHNHGYELQLEGLT